MFDLEQFRNEFQSQGCCLVRRVMPDDFVRRMTMDLEEAIRLEASYHEGTAYQDYGMVLLCSLYGRSFVELFDIQGFVGPLHAVLGEGCIVYAYTSSSLPPESTNYSNRIHVDSPRLIPGYVTNIGAIILLVDFTEYNGATWYLPASHQLADAPSREEFDSNARRLIARAGDVWYFNARLWHQGGVNVTREWRHAVTLNMCRPWMKQRIDIPRAMHHMDLSWASEKSLQKLGFHAQVPASYDEYYVPPEMRKFRQRTE